jgi:hypothetical protein
VKRQTQVSPLDRFASIIEGLERRIAALERNGHIHESVVPPPPDALNGGTPASAVTTLGPALVDGGTPADAGAGLYDGGVP